MRVLVAMSGGVDSSVTAALLIEQGHEVVGATMKLWGGTSDSGCCSLADVEDARRVAQQLGIAHQVFNFTEEFDTHVVDRYVESHSVGITPNPCVECNRHLKFDRFIRRAQLLKFDAVATGHHARIRYDQQSSQYKLLRGVDQSKDQSYVLHMLNQASMSKTLLPVGEMNKAEVREIADRLGLRTAAKPDSQDVCFIMSTGGREAFLGDRISMKSAKMIDSDGNQIGEVPAVEMVTIGQRRGLGIANSGSTKTNMPDRRFAIDVDVSNGVVRIGTYDELCLSAQQLGEMTWTDEPIKEKSKVLVQASAHGKPVAATWTDSSVVYDQPHRRIAPGQSVVLYDCDDLEVLGGGVALRSWV